MNNINRLNPSHTYLNSSHLGDSMFFDRIIEDSKRFMLDELINIANDSSLELYVRETALFMVGAQWNMNGLDQILKILQNDLSVGRYLEEVLKYYSCNEAKDFVIKLSLQKLITESKAKFIIELIDENIKYGRDPVKKWGRAVFKDSE